MREFRCRTKIICGSGAVSQLQQLKPQRLFLVTDPYFAKNGGAQRIAKESGACTMMGSWAVLTSAIHSEPIMATE